MQFTCSGTDVRFDEKTLRFAFRRDGADWTWRDGFMPSFDCHVAGRPADAATVVPGHTTSADSDQSNPNDRIRTFAFADAASITHELRETGTGVGVFSTFRGFGDAPDFAFATYVWVERASGDVICEWMPLDETGLSVTRLTWPGEMTFDGESDRDVTLITHQQGVMIPNTWPTAVSSAHGDIVFGGRFETAGGYMPWFAQIRGSQADCGKNGNDEPHDDRDGRDDGRDTQSTRSARISDDDSRPTTTGAPAYIAICETPWNAGYAIEHPAGGRETPAEAGNVAAGTFVGTCIGMWFEPSLGRMDYRRVVRYRFLSDADHTSVAKSYRAYVDERGRLRTLAEKAARNPSVRNLIGCSWMHVGIKTVVQPESRFYDREHPENNLHVTSFAARAKQLATLHELGAGRIYMHLDGWAEPGYDNQHPDYLPACEEAGGWAGMKALVDACHARGDLFGTHDQYRDYYFDARTFDRNNAVRLPDGTNPEQTIWAGGHQTFLCAELAPDYVRRNFAEIAANGVRLDCAYLDVFTCNEGDECANPEHRMTRRDCYERRAECFEYLLSHGILSSSEEVSDWAVPSLVFCHYAPYDFQMRDPSAPRQGVPVPLYNLVYHDCVIEPWMMERVAGGDDYMLYALLNGGAPYLIRDAAYVGVDGDMSPEQRAQAENDIERCNAVAALHERVGMSELVRHDFVGGDPLVQRSVFADGTVVTCDFHDQTYRIEG
ncbi:DUF5696 domain-containing protein [Bifidobacterium biavatii]|uniref:Uncharacterized protein n=1 Tax=Bifidobacterium biavatii DSM 23969 TaxID=1437608 RepID=A0A086ZW35_9BIFI|nr:DUF5696 domain-containing protein [Bifidobacterium biavatii]KFI50735.1 hypothetical protein BBIA_1527 [Bifidobacterium biavatii DSM 23969]